MITSLPPNDGEICCWEANPTINIRCVNTEPTRLRRPSVRFHHLAGSVHSRCRPASTVSLTEQQMSLLSASSNRRWSLSKVLPSGKPDRHASWPGIQRHGWQETPFGDARETAGTNGARMNVCRRTDVGYRPPINRLPASAGKHLQVRATASPRGWGFQTPTGRTSDPFGWTRWLPEPAHDRRRFPVPELA